MIPNAPFQAFQYVDVFVIVVLFVVLGVLLLGHYRKNGSVLSSISTTVAATARTSLVFSVTMSILYPLYYAWLWLWVGPRADMPAGYYWLLAIGAVFEFVFVWVPATSGLKKRIHELSAGIVAVIMLVLPGVLLAGYSDMSTVGRAMTVLYYAIAVVIAVLMAIPRYRKHTLAYEVAFCVAFLLALSIVGHS